MSFANPLPAWALTLVIIAAAALAWHAYRGFADRPFRRRVLTTIRFVTLLALVVVLMRPVARITRADARDVVVPILVDTSRSMAIEDVNGRARMDVAREWLTHQLPALAGRFHVETLAFGEGLAEARPDAMKAVARRTDLAGALAAARERYRGRPVAGFVVLTDGSDTGPAVDVEAYSENLPPVFAVPVGATVPGRDREVLSVTAAESALDGSRLDLAVSAVSRGERDGSLELRLLENGRPVQVRHVARAVDGAPVREVFQVSPGSGTATIYTVEIPAVAGELVPENNARSVLVQPPVRTRRVLVVEGAPGFEHAFFRRALADDRGIEIDAVVRKGKNEQGVETYYVQAAKGRGQALADGYPRDAATLFSYDAIVLANVGGDQLTGEQMEATREFVRRRGGGVVVFGAQAFLGRGLAGTPIEDVLPIELSRRMDAALPATESRGANRVSLTDAGFVHPITRLGATADETRKRWEALPALASAASLGSPRPGATILANTSGAGGVMRPLIAVQRYGEGRSIVFAGEASWRWRMLLPSSDRSFETFWRQAVRWVSLSATDPVTLLPVSAGAPGDEVLVRTVVRDGTFDPQRDADVDVRVAGPDGKLQELRAAAEPGDAFDGAAYVARFTPEQPGVYRVSASARRGSTSFGSASTATLVGAADLEMADPRLNMAGLERLSVATGGRVIQPQATDLADALSAAAPAAALAVQKDLWHNAWSFGLIVGLLATEWLVRRRWGLR